MKTSLKLIKAHYNNFLNLIDLTNEETSTREQIIKVVKGNLENELIKLERAKREELIKECDYRENKAYKAFGLYYLEYLILIDLLYYNELNKSQLIKWIQINLFNLLKDAIKEFEESN